MASSMQAKVQLLALLVVVFTLLSVPLFFQVRADAQNDRESANSTFFSKLFRDAFKKAPENAEIEDVWAQRAREQNPNCGAECDPQGDLDGDGVSNKDELAQGRNPSCSEAEKGYEYCQGQPQYSKPKPNETQPSSGQGLRDVLYSGRALGAGSRQQFEAKPVGANYDRWEVSWNATGYQSVESSFRIVVQDHSNQDVCCDAQGTSVFSQTYRGNQTLDADRVPAPGTYSISIQSQPLRGTWDLLVVGVRAAA